MWEHLFARLGKDKNYSLKKKKVMKHELSLHMIANWYIYFSEKSLETIKCCHRCYIKNNVLFTTFRAITQINYVIYTCRHLHVHQYIEEHKGSVIGNHVKEQHGREPNILTSSTLLPIVGDV